MDLNIKEHLTLDEQIQEWYCSNNKELQKLSKYLSQKIQNILDECLNNNKRQWKEGYREGFDKGYDMGYSDGMDLMIISMGG